MYASFIGREPPVLGTPPNLIVSNSPQCGFICWGDAKTKPGGRGTPLQIKKDQFSIKTLLSQKNLKWSKTGLWQRLYTQKKKSRRRLRLFHQERNKERKKEISLVLFKSQHDTFQCLTAPHRCASPPRAIRVGPNHGQKKFGSNTRDLSGFSQYWGFIGFFSNTGGLSELPLKIQGLIFDEPPVFWYFGR